MTQPAPSKLGHRPFWKHLGQQGLYAALIVGVSLVGGTVGFHAFAHQPWVDAILNASMLLGGMGAVGDLGQTPGKLFAAGYALYAGLVFLIVAGLLVTPVIHGVLRRFHLDGKRAAG